MARRQQKRAGRKKRRSAAQRDWTSAMARTAKTWEWLTDEQRLTWNTAGSTRRMSGYSYYMRANVRRVRDGAKPLGLPAPAAPPAENPVGRLLITWRGNRVKLELEVPREPTAPITVWASRPCKRGWSNCDKVPLAGPLPPPKGGRSDITALYFKKHGAYIKQKHVQLAGKRIFLCTRVELDGWTGLKKPTSALIPRREAGDEW